MTAQTSIRQALETAVASLPAIDTAWENYPLVPTDGQPYQEVFVLFAEPSNPTVGAALYQERGILQVNLCYPLQPPGVRDVSERAGLLRDLFKRGASFQKDGVTTIVERTPEIAPGRRDGDRWVVPVKVRFYANVVTG